MTARPLTPDEESAVQALECLHVPRAQSEPLLRALNSTGSPTEITLAVLDMHKQAQQWPMPQWQGPQWPQTQKDWTRVAESTTWGYYKAQVKIWIFVALMPFILFALFHFFCLVMYWTHPH